MKQNYLLKNGTLINEGRISRADIYIEDGMIHTIQSNISQKQTKYIEIDCTDKYIIPGMIDDQVHFREPGAVYKADVYTESRAAVSGGITSFMDMPNTKPSTITNSLLEEKKKNAVQKAWANYSFYLGATNDNLEEILRVDNQKTCGVKVFMGSSTGNMLVNDPKALDGIFSKSTSLIATHCEDEEIIRKNTELFQSQFGDDIPIEHHPKIRNHEACLKSSTFAMNLAKEYGTRLHILHLTTKEEIESIQKYKASTQNNNITFEVCVHHLWFSNEDYARLGAFIKCNPAIKYMQDRDALLNAVNMDAIDVIASDHAPHTLEEKKNIYMQSPAGLPLVQHSLYILLELYYQGKITLEKIVSKTSHAVADLFKIKNRGYLREGYYADIAIFDLNQSLRVNSNNIYYKCQWSPFIDTEFHAVVTHTFVNGSLIYQNGEFFENNRSPMPLEFSSERK